MRTSARFHDLPLAGQLLTWAARHWLRAYALGQMIPRCVWQSFSAAEITPVYAELTELLGVLAGHELLPTQFEAPNSPSLGDEEYRFLKFVLSPGTADLANVLSGREPCPAIQRAAAARAARLVIHLERAGFRLGLPAPLVPAVASRPVPALAHALH